MQLPEQEFPEPQTVYTRRQFLLTFSLAGLLCACGREDLLPPIPLSPRPLSTTSSDSENPLTVVTADERLAIRRMDGPWLNPEKELLGYVMIKLGQEGYHNISGAGLILVKNSSEPPSPSFSTVSPYFEDTRLVVRNEAWAKVTNLFPDLSIPSNYTLALMYSDIRPNGSRVKVEFPNPTTAVTQRTGFRYVETVVNSYVINQISDFLLELAMAREIFLVQAIQLVSQYFSRQSLIETFGGPINPQALAAITVNDFEDRKASIDGVPFSFIAGKYATYALSEDYLLAVDRSKFTPADQPFLSQFQQAADFFMHQRVLIKTPQGEYRWNQNLEQLVTGAWFALAKANYQTQQR